MPAPSNIVLTPDSGVAPFSIQISGTNLFERPSYRAKETFTTNTAIQLIAYRNWIVAGSDDKIFENPSGDAPPDGTPVRFANNAGVGALILGGVVLVMSTISQYYDGVGSIRYVRRITGYTNRWGLVDSPTATEADILQMTGTFITNGTNYYLYHYYHNKNAEGVWIGSRCDSDVSSWVGSNPTRIDGIIGKAMIGEPDNDWSTANIMPCFYYNAGVTQPQSGGNNLFPSEIQTTFFISLWIKPSTSYDSSSVYRIISLGRAASNVSAANCMYTIGGTNGITLGYGDRIQIWKGAGDKLVVGMHGRTTNSYSTGAYALKNIFAPLPVANPNGINGVGAFENGKWNHILVQWNGDALGYPDMWINGEKLLQSSFGYVKNDSLVAFSNVQSSLFSASAGQIYSSVSILGAGADSSVTSAKLPTSILPTWTAPTNNTVASTNQAFSGAYCDIYTGNVFLTDAQVLMYANLPKVEMVKV